MNRFLFVFGTRPEAIKMASVIKEAALKGLEHKVCVTGQHKEMLASVLETFNITPDYDLKVMKDAPQLADIYAKILQGLQGILEHYPATHIIVHGDTATTFASSLCAHLNRVEVVHVEAGLRSKNLYSPWPEEANRKLTGVLSSLHFCPTQAAKNNLLQENIPESSIEVVGNTVIDALLLGKKMLTEDQVLVASLEQRFAFMDETKKLLLVTGHRRENLGDGFENICQALKRIAKEPNVYIVYPVHLNPKVKDHVTRILGNQDNIFLIDPVEYLAFIYLMDKSYLILTDSGGIQEEAPSLGKPVLVMRDTTERPEAVEAGTAKLVGTDTEVIIKETLALFDPHHYYTIAQIANPFGDGTTSTKIVNRLLML